jgi:hypothetical protein
MLLSWVGHRFPKGRKVSCIMFIGDFTIYCCDRQANMDYSLCEAVKYSNVGAIQKIIHLYDINCQYHIYFANRVDDSLYLSMPSHHEIYHGIGLMHIGTHCPEIIEVVDQICSDVYLCLDQFGLSICEKLVRYTPRLQKSLEAMYPRLWRLNERK